MVPIMFIKKDAVHFVSVWYIKDIFLWTYEQFIEPISSMKSQPTIDYPIVSPPPLRAPPGRPKKARRKEEDEPKDSSRIRRRDGSLRCKNCQQQDYSLKTCKGPRKEKTKMKEQKIGASQTGSTISRKRERSQI